MRRADLNRRHSQRALSKPPFFAAHTKPGMLLTRTALTLSRRAALAGVPATPSYSLSRGFSAARGAPGAAGPLGFAAVIAAGAMSTATAASLALLQEGAASSSSSSSSAVSVAAKDGDNSVEAEKKNDDNEDGFVAVFLDQASRDAIAAHLKQGSGGGFARFCDPL